MSVSYSIKSGKKFFDIPLNDKATVRDLKKAFAALTKKDINRVSFKAGVARLDDDSKSLVGDYKLSSGSEITFKDLGPQIGYRTVFLVEYFGPMVFVLLYALRPKWIYGNNDSNSSPYNIVALTGIICWVAHFMKREFETIFVHKFSRPTMPLSNLFKNCAYYWIFGLVIGYPLCSPSYVPPSTIEFYIGFAIFTLCEIGNFTCHVMLSNLRPADGSKTRPIPTGFLFDYVACPNYFFEVFSWVGFSVMTAIPFSWAFTIVGLLQMGDWALKKHKEYKKTYDKEYISLKRKAMIPFIF